MDSLVCFKSRPAIFALVVTGAGGNVARQMVAGVTFRCPRITHLTRLTINTPSSQTVFLLSSGARCADGRANGISLGSRSAIDTFKRARIHLRLTNQAVGTRRLTPLIVGLWWFWFSFGVWGRLFCIAFFLTHLTGGALRAIDRTGPGCIAAGYALVTLDCTSSVGVITART